MAGVYKIFGIVYPPQYIAFCLISALTCGLVYLTGQELGSESFAISAPATAAGRARLRIWGRASRNRK